MKLSIIIPVYNVENYLEACIKSILQQNHDEYELLLVDDGSKDKGGEICDKYAKTNSNIKVFHIKNGGPSLARNYGLDMAKGEFVQFVDSDDCITPESLSIFSKAISEIDADLFIAGTSVRDVNDEETDTIVPNISKCDSSKNILNKMIPSEKPMNLHYIWNKWYRRETIEKNKIRFNTSVSLGEDFLFNCQFFKHCRTINHMQDIVYWYYKRGNQTLSQKYIPSELNRRRLMDGALIDLYKYYGILEEHQDEINKMLGEMTTVSLESVTRAGKNILWKDKKIFLENFLNSEYYAYLKEYKPIAATKGLFKRMELWCLLQRKINLFIALLNIRKFKNKYL